MFVSYCIYVCLIPRLWFYQGNGHERDFMGRKDVYILDIYNKYIYPNDSYAKKAIRRRVELFAYTQDEEYLEKVNT